MKTRTIWVADDGKEFDTEKECVAYENRFNSYEAILRDEAEIEFYSNGERVTDIKIDSFWDILCNCDLMIVKTNEAILALHEIADRAELGSMPRRIGIFTCDFKLKYYNERLMRVDTDLLKKLSAIPNETLKAMSK